MKKDNLLGLLILFPMLIFLGFHIYTFSNEVFSFFPNHLLSLLFCIISMYLYVLVIFSKKRERIIGLFLSTIIILTAIIYNLCINKNTTYKTILMCSSEDLVINMNTKLSINNNYGNVFVSLEDFDYSQEYCINGDFNKVGKTILTIKNNDKEYKYNLIIKRNSYELEEFNE